MSLWSVGYSVEYYETFLQNNSWTHSDIQNFPFLNDKLCCSIFVHVYVIYILMHYMISSYLVIHIIGESIPYKELQIR